MVDGDELGPVGERPFHLDLVELAGLREVHGLNALSEGRVDDARRAAGVERAAQAGFQGAGS